MKKLLLTLLLFVGLALGNAKAQSGVRAGAYYSQRYSVSNVCNGCNCRRAVWHSAIGGHYVYVWNGFSWIYVWRQGYYYWYTWTNYNRCY